MQIEEGEFLKVALCQMNILWEDKQGNQEKAEGYIKEAAEQGVVLILFPEMSLTGFSMNINKTKEQDGRTIDFFSCCAWKYHIYIGFGWTKATEKEDKAENHFTIVSPDKRIVLDYIKIHPFHYGKEDLFFLPGQEIVTCKIQNFKISTFICYDLRFPELFQAVSNKVDMIIIPANWPEKRREHWQCLLKARAIENQVYILGINGVGMIGDQRYAGDSCIIDPGGNIMESLSYEEGLVICPMDNLVEEFRQAFPMKQDRKEELYRTWI